MVVIAVSSIFHPYFIGLLHHHRSAALSPHDSLPYSTLLCPALPYPNVLPFRLYPVLPHLLSCPILCILTSLPILSSRFTHHPSPPLPGAWEWVVKEQKRCQEIMDFKIQGDKYFRSSKHAEAAWSYGKAINVRSSTS